LGAILGALSWLAHPVFGVPLPYMGCTLFVLLVAWVATGSPQQRELAITPNSICYRERESSFLREIPWDKVVAIDIDPLGEGHGDGPGLLKIYGPTTYFKDMISIDLRFPGFHEICDLSMHFVICDEPARRSILADETPCPPRAKDHFFRALAATNNT
jgi:hypothetical protein